MICTENQTYSLRQVNTSNSVYLVRPEDGGAAGDGFPKPALQAVAQSSFTLELNPVSSKASNAIPYLRAALPTYSSTGHYLTKQPIPKRELFANISLSERECEAAFNALACFEMQDPRGCFIPSGVAKVRAWKSILEQALAHGIDVTVPLTPAQSSVLVDPSEDWPAELTQSVRDCILGDSRKERDSIHTKVSISKIGLNLLESSGQGTRTSTPVSDFLSAWADQLPEKWREEVSLELLKNSEIDGYVLENGGKDIKFAVSMGAGGTSSSEAPPRPAESKSLGAKRKWHEKFRSSKKPA